MENAGNGGVLHVKKRLKIPGEGDLPQLFLPVPQVVQEHALGGSQAQLLGVLLHLLAQSVGDGAQIAAQVDFVVYDHRSFQKK